MNTSHNNQKLKICIPLIQNELNGRIGWIAGFYFIKNILNAFESLPIEEIPHIVIFVPSDFDELIFKVNPSWLEIVYIPVEKLANLDNSSEIENLINSYECNIIFPFINIPQYNLNGKKIGWIADFQDKYLKNLFNENEIYHRELLNDFITQYNHKILCTSHDVLKDIKIFYPNHTSKYHVVSFCSVLSPDVFQVNPDDCLKEFHINEKYIYLPNQFWIHKNHRMVFEAWNKLNNDGFKYLLICTGAKNDHRNPDYYEKLEDYIKHHQLEDHIRLLGFIDREKQIQLYRGASAILQPSLFEGWNTSLEDAKAFGKTIIASNIAVHREQCGDTAIYFDGNSSEDLITTMQSIWSRLPNGHDINEETKAYTSYLNQIRQFAKNMIHFFKETSDAPNPDDNTIINLLIHTHRLLTVSQKNNIDRLQTINDLNRIINDLNKDSVIQLNLIQQLHHELNRPIKVKLKNKIKRLFYSVKGKIT